MWNEQTKQMVADEKLVVLGVVQEQHAERARLYKQWKQYKFPIVQDSVTSLGLAVVPVPILIDEYGYVASANPKIKTIAALVANETSRPEKPAPKLNPEHVTSKWLKGNVGDGEMISSKLAIGDALLREKTELSTKDAISCYLDAIETAINNREKENAGLAYFRAGVAYRRMFDIAPPGEQDPDDFSAAAKYWSEALAANPNQYIWRRRIQQYGPRQAKPYPFYDWVEKAKQEITARGETPVELAVPLSGAELAQPQRKFPIALAAENPDPENKINHDEEAIIQFDATVVPHIITPGKSVRVHLRFKPNGGHWNNEAEEMVAWINSPTSGSVAQSRLSHPNAKDSSSDESRTLEFEYRTAADATGEVELEGYAIYYVCKTDDGQCLYRRQDFKIPIQIRSKK